MILIEAVDTALAIWDALVITILVLAALAVPAVLLAAWAVTRAVKWAWRVFGPQARRDGCAPAGAPHSPSCDSSDTGTPPEASSARTADPGYEEVA